MDSKDLEKYSSAITLSDMEVFVFPELMMSLVLANIMSPLLWRWRDEECFKKLDDKSPYKKLMRLKQFIMDRYDFNLDLQTWGLTSQDREMKRFEEFISPRDIERSNALFGYTGDKYYFDVDIRRHFGLDKYDGDVIPYWKTETLEAMNAFRLKDGYSTGAGECVSLSTLYAAATFVVCGIPLEDIYMVLTPLHSQNFIDIQDGVLTNNRRIITKTMWFNGTAISNKAQRALRNERVTVVGHSTGYIHCLYDRATIEKKLYDRFRERLADYLSADLTLLTVTSFLRSHDRYHRYFQFCRQKRGSNMFVKAEVLFHYEHGSNFQIAGDTYDKLLASVSDEDYMIYKPIDRMCCEQLMNFVNYEAIDIQDAGGQNKLIEYLSPFMPNADEFVAELASFLRTEARLPGPEKEYVTSGAIDISVDQSREQIIEHLAGIREGNTTADLAFYAYRDMEYCQWEPFIKAAIERNPVSIEMLEGKTIAEVYTWLCKMKNDSIYDGKRLAQPDEVANFNTGDGVEKAILLANIIRSRESDTAVDIDVDRRRVTVRAGDEYRFESSKELEKIFSANYGI